MCKTRELQTSFTYAYLTVMLSHTISGALHGKGSEQLWLLELAAISNALPWYVLLQKGHCCFQSCYLQVQAHPLVFACMLVLDYMLWSWTVC